jgi:uncharacterized lipoprotein YmbA
VANDREKEMKMMSRHLSVVNPTFLLYDLRVVTPAKAGIQIERTGFPRIPWSGLIDKYGAGLIKSGMTKYTKSFLEHHTTLLTWVLIGTFLVTLSGCASSPSSRFYLLHPLSGPASEGKPTASDPCVSIGIGPIEIPDYLDQPQIVTRVTPNEIKLAEFERWAEPLEDNLKRVLAQNLSNLVCTKEISFFPWRRGIPMDYRVEMKIIRFDGNPGDKVILEAWWRLRSGDGKTVHQSKRSSFSESVTGGDYKSLVLAHSQVLGALSREIAEAIKTIK